MTAFGGKGYFVQTPEELRKALVSCLAQEKMPSLINVMIDPSSGRKKQVSISGGEHFVSIKMDTASLLVGDGETMMEEFLPQSRCISQNRCFPTLRKLTIP